MLIHLLIDQYLDDCLITEGKRAHTLRWHRASLKQFKEYVLNPRIVWPEQSRGPVGQLKEAECRRRQSWGRPDKALWHDEDGEGGRLYLFTNGLLIRKTFHNGGEQVAII